MSDDNNISVLFVCLGNICRSPTAEAVMRHLVKGAGLQNQIHIDSAGTGNWHVGEPPDKRSAATGAQRGIPLSGKARQVTPQDFADFDYVLALDRSNYANLQKLAPNDEALQRLHLLRSFDEAADDEEVPDPYHGGSQGFENVYDICMAACGGLLKHVVRQHGLQPQR